MPERKLPVVYAVVSGDGFPMDFARSRDRAEEFSKTRTNFDPLVVEYIPRAQASEVVTRVFSAWLRDRAEQYSNDTCCRCVFDELMNALDDGEPWEALKHGELDDILLRSRNLR